jgi:hypothetical protein
MPRPEEEGWAPGRVLVGASLPDFIPVRTESESRGMAKKPMTSVTSSTPPTMIHGERPERRFCSEAMRSFCNWSSFMG